MTEPFWDHAEWRLQSKELLVKIAQFMTAMRLGMVKENDTSLSDGITDRLEKAYQIGFEQAVERAAKVVESYLPAAAVDGDYVSESLADIRALRYDGYVRPAEPAPDVS